MKRILLTVILVCSLGADKPNVPTRVADLERQVDSLERRVQELERELADLKNAPPTVLPATQPSDETDLAVKSHRLVTGMTMAQVVRMFGYEGEFFQQTDKGKYYRWPAPSVHDYDSGKEWGTPAQRQMNDQLIEIRFTDGRLAAWRVAGPAGYGAPLH